MRIGDPPVSIIIPRTSFRSGSNLRSRSRRSAFKLGFIRAQKTKSEIYLECLPAINSGRVELLDNARLMAQLRSLERRTSRAGRDTIDHPPGAHDDLANAVAGALVLAPKRGAAALFPGIALPGKSYWRMGEDDDDD